MNLILFQSSFFITFINKKNKNNLIFLLYFSRRLFPVLMKEKMKKYNFFVCCFIFNYHIKNISDKRGLKKKNNCFQIIVIKTNATNFLVNDVDFQC